MQLDAKSFPIQPTRTLAPAPKAAEDEPGNPAVDKFTDALGMQGLVQDSSRVAQLSAKGGNAVRVVADVAAGDKLAISGVAIKAMRGVSHMTVGMAPVAAARANRIAANTLQGAGGVARVTGKWGPILSIPFAGYDVAKAVKEHDPVKKRAAWANATLTVGGTILGTAGALLLATPAGLPLLLGSGAIAAVQLCDTYLLKGKLMQGLGDGVAKLWKAIKR